MSWYAHSVNVMLWATQSRPRANSCFMSMIHSVSSASSSDAPAPRNLHCELYASNRTATEVLCKKRLWKVVQAGQQVSGEYRLRQRTCVAEGLRAEAGDREELVLAPCGAHVGGPAVPHGALHRPPPPARASHVSLNHHQQQEPQHQHPVRTCQEQRDTYLRMQHELCCGTYYYHACAHAVGT